MISISVKLIDYGDLNLQDLVTGVEDISFTIKGDNFNKTVKTGKDDSVSVEVLFSWHLYHHRTVH